MRLNRSAAGRANRWNPGLRREPPCGSPRLARSLLSEETRSACMHSHRQKRLCGRSHALECAVQAAIVSPARAGTGREDRMADVNVLIAFYSRNGSTEALAQA